VRKAVRIGRSLINLNAFLIDLIVKKKISKILTDKYPNRILSRFWTDIGGMMFRVFLAWFKLGNAKVTAAKADLARFCSSAIAGAIPSSQNLQYRPSRLLPFGCYPYLNHAVFFALATLSLSSLLVAQPTNGQLHLQDIPKIMQQIFDQHLDQKAMKTKTLKSAFIAYIDHFDPNRIYLLQSEVQPYRDMSDAQLEEVLAQYKLNNFDPFLKLNDLIQRSIVRARAIRNKIISQPKKLFSDEATSDVAEGWEDPDLKRSFAANEQDLEKRIYKAMLEYLDLEKKQYGPKWVSLNHVQAIETLENHYRENENAYLYHDEKDHLLSSAQQEDLFAEHLLKAFAGSLDAHTTFYSRSEAYDVKRRLQKSFQGVGVALQQYPDGLVVISGMTPQGPADRSGQLKVGDRLLEVDGQSVIKEPLDKVVEMMHGEQGQKLSLKIQRKGEDPKNVVLTRENITLNEDRVDVTSIPFRDGIIGVITLHSFYQSSGGVTSEEDVRNALAKLRDKGELLGLILDLRENSGGFLGQAVKVAGLFITNGVIVISKYFNGEQHFYRDLDSKVFYDGPFVVLTSRATASAAEIVAQALQDYGVALVVGDEQTYGKGTIQNQTVTDNKSTSFFKVTVGRYYTVSGKTPQIDGVTADILAPGIFAFEHIGEKYLASTVPSDKIADDYNDDLSDVSAGSRAWFLRYYMPTLQHKKTQWINMLPALKASSQQRILHNPGYQKYLKNLKKGFIEAGQRQDFQLDEAINVVEEMIEASTSKPEKKSYF
jgi:carboxyl-terminal processing protease